MSNTLELPANLTYGEGLISLMEKNPEIKKIVSSALAQFRRGEPLKKEFAKFASHLRLSEGEDPLKYFTKFYLGVEELASKKLPSAGELFRVNLQEYAMLLAVSAATRSEDPSRKTGACALDFNGRCVATAYNGLASGTQVDFTWWDNDENRRKKVIHAEENLVSLTARGNVHTVAVTLLPCGPCARLLAAHGVKVVLYGREYRHDTDGKEILEDYGVELKFLSAQGAADDLKNTLPFIL